MKNLAYLLFAIGILGASCSQESKHDAAWKELKSLEGETLNKTMVDPQLGKKLVERYQYFANTFPEDSVHASDCLIKGSEVANAMGNGKQAEQLLISALQKYPKHANAAKALFMLAFCNENTLGNQAEAEKRYKEFLEKYPNDKLAASAKSALDNLGKTPEELIKEFEAKNATKK